jgi:septal ring-binding cell division protein DamX
MVDDDFTYHVRQQSAGQINTGINSLITRERMQKLDLLIHLLSNLPQALVVCGQEGIGKTTLLNVLQERKKDSWRYCSIQGNSALSFEVVHRQIALCISQDRTFESTGSLSMDFKQYENLNKHIIVIVDNAGELVPGLITTIIQYAAANPALRVIFALTHDELQVKRGSDRAVDDCHIIEIPPLSAKQCGDFLQYLSTRPHANVSLKAISENMIEHIYRETQGIPGSIIAEISDMPDAKPDGKMKWMLIVAIAAALAAAIGVQWLLSSSDDKQEAAPEKQQTDNAVSPVQQSQVIQPVPQQSPQLPPAVVSEPVNPALETNIASIDQQPVVTTPKVEVPSAPEIIQKQEVIQPPAVTQKPVEPVAAPPVPEQPKPVEAAKTVNETQASSLGKQENKMQPVLVAPIAPVSKPAVVSIPAPQVVAEQPLASRQEKPKPPEAIKNGFQLPAPEKQEVKQQVLPAAAPVAPVTKPIAAPAPAQQIVVGQPANRLEPPKQMEISQPIASVNTVQPVAPNTLETIQLPQKPVDIAPAPEQPNPAAEPQQIQPVESLVASENNFTLQLMVLSKQSSADEILRKYPAMAPDFRVVNSFANGRPKFILEYGSYPDAATANKAKQSLPFEFRKALVRKINSNNQR